MLSLNTRGRGHAAGLDQPAILTAAVQLLAAAGSHGLSMRRLATRLGVTPNALYNHFKNKTELIDALLDDALGLVDTPTTDDPLSDLLSIMVSTFDALTARGDLVPLYLDRRGARGPNAIALGERMLEAFRSLGVEASTAQLAIHVLVVQVIGFAGYGATDDPHKTRESYVHSTHWTLQGVLMTYSSEGPSST